MSGPTAGKMQELKRHGHSERPSRQPFPGHHGTNAATEILDLQQTIGNQAVMTLTQGAIPTMVQSAINDSGQQLEPGLRTNMESRFDQDFSHVRIHTDSRAADSAEAMGATAYTVGNNVVFEKGRYAPNTSTGKHLIAHELAHVVQQRRGGTAPTLDRNGRLEHAADNAADSAQEGSAPVEVAGASAVGVARQAPKQPDQTGTTDAKAGEEDLLSDGKDYRADPTYVDNIDGMSYDVSNTQLSIKHKDGIWLDVPFEQVSRRVSKAPPGPAVDAARQKQLQAQAEKYGIKLPESSGSIGGFVTARIMTFRRRANHIFPLDYNEQTTPNIMKLWREGIEPRIVEKSRDVLFAVADVALAARGVAGGATGPKPAAPAKPPAPKLKTAPGNRASDALNRTIQGVDDVVRPGSVGGSVNPATRPPITAPAPKTPRPTLDDVIKSGRTASPARASTPTQTPAPGKAAPAQTPARPAADVGTKAPGVGGPTSPSSVVSRSQSTGPSVLPPVVSAARAAGQAASVPGTSTAPASRTSASEAAESPKVNAPDSGPASDAYPRNLEDQVNQYTAAREKSRQRRDEILTKARELEAEIVARKAASNQDSKTIADETKRIGEQLTKGDLTPEARTQALQRRQQIVDEQRQLIAEREYLAANQMRVRQAAKIADDQYFEGVSASARGGSGHAAAGARAGDRDEVFAAQGGISTEHIVARDLIRQKPDFQKLSRAQQVEVFDLEPNLVRMSGSANSSKGNLHWRDWPEDKWRKFTNDPSVIQRMVRNEAKADRYIDDYIKWLLGTGPKPQPPTLEL